MNKQRRRTSILILIILLIIIGEDQFLGLISILVLIMTMAMIRCLDIDDKIKKSKLEQEIQSLSNIKENTTKLS